jgi:hypothetical protein
LPDRVDIPARDPHRLKVAAPALHLDPASGIKIVVTTLSMTMSTLRRPIAFIPLAMSFAALGLVLAHIAIYGVARQADEGAAAHIWQLLMAGQMPVVALFAITWLPRVPRQALLVLGLQVLAGMAAAAPVFILRW